MEKAVTLGGPFQRNSTWTSVTSKPKEDETWSLPLKCVTVLLFPSTTSTDGPDGQRALNQPPMNEGIRYPLVKRCSTSFRWRKKFHFFIFLDPLVQTGTLCFKMSGKPGLRILKGQPFPLSWISTLPGWLFIFCQLPLRVADIGRRPRP